jgi:hypothetical protein
MAPSKITMATIHELREEMQEAPAYEAQEVSMVRAIQLLAPHIRTMKAKGYTMDHIARSLSSAGIPIAATTLRSYLSRFAMESALKPLHNGNRRATNRRAIRPRIPPTSTEEG